MRVTDMLTATLESSDTIAFAARRMADDDVGVLLILDDGTHDKPNKEILR